MRLLFGRLIVAAALAGVAVEMSFRKPLQAVLRCAGEALAMVLEGWAMSDLHPITDIFRPVEKSLLLTQSGH